MYCDYMNYIKHLWIIMYYIVNTINIILISKKYVEFYNLALLDKPNIIHIKWSKKENEHT